MKILLIAPEPFYQERGTPLAVSFLLKALSERGEDIDLLTYHEGESRRIPAVRHYRIPRLLWLNSVRPGFSWKKVLCDGLMLLRAFQLAKTYRYNLVHAVEEGVFIALVLKIFFRVPYIYDMDSSLVEQLVVRYPSLKFCESMLHSLVQCAVRNALVVAPACESLSDMAQGYGARETAVLPDISLFSIAHKRAERSSEHGRTVLLYVGNLEPYQGIDIMLDAFRLVIQELPELSLVIAGGDPVRVRSYKKRAQEKNIEKNTLFLGHRPIDELSGLLEGADILVSPRLAGSNVPMKIHSYVSSGRPVIATNIPAHTELLDDTCSRLCEATPESLADAMASLIRDPDQRNVLGQRARERYKDRRSYSVLKGSIDTLYDSLAITLSISRRETAPDPHLVLR